MRNFAWIALCALLMTACAANRQEETVAYAAPATTAPEAAQADPAQVPARTANASTGERLPEMVCSTEKVMGSIMPRRVCRTRRTVEQDRDSADEYMRGKSDYDAINEDRSFER